MKAHLMLAGAVLLAGQAVTSAYAQTSAYGQTTTTAVALSGKPAVMQDTSTGEPIYVLPAHPNEWDQYKANWLFYNLDDRDVKRYEAEGFNDWTIRGCANLSLYSGYPMQFFLDMVRTGGYPLDDLAIRYGVPPDKVNEPFKGMGAQSIAYAPENPYTTGQYATAAATIESSNSNVPSVSIAASSSLPAVQNDLFSVISTDPRFTTLTTAIRSAGLQSTLEQPGPFTLFAPTNDAFSRLPAGTLDSWLKPENQAQLKSVLLYSLISGRVLSSDITAMSAPGTPRSIEGETLTINNVAPIHVNGAAILAADIPASNGVIQAIDTVLIPPSMSASITSPANGAAPANSTPPATQMPPAATPAPTTPASPSTPSMP